MNDLWRHREPSFLTTIVLIAALIFYATLPDRTFAGSPGAKPTVQVLAAWIRWLPAGLPAAGYLTLTNAGDKPLTLVSASSASYGDVSLHRTVTHGDVEDMMPVQALTLEPHQTLEFETTGYHLMLMQPKASADTSPRIEIVLRFSDGSVLPVTFEVRRHAAGGSAPP
jgi:copper(I)-binding protein